MPNPPIIHPDEKISFVKRIPVGVRLILVFLLLSFPLFFLWVVFKPIVRSRVPVLNFESLPKIFSQSQLFRFAQQYKAGGEYDFYFLILSDASLSRAVAEVHQVLSPIHDKITMRDRLAEAQAKVETMALDINGMYFPDSFVSNPFSQPDLVFSLWNFLYEEFKVTVMALSYRSLYDPVFFLVWSGDSMHAGRQAQKLIVSFTDEQRQKAEELFVFRHLNPTAAAPRGIK